MLSEDIGTIKQRITTLERRLNTLETQDRLGNITAGAILFGGSTGLPTFDASNLYWDDTNDKLGIGTNSPVGYLSIKADEGSGLQSTRPRHIFIQGSTNTNLKGEIGFDTTLKTFVIGALEEGVAWRNIVLANNGGNVGIGTQAIVPSGLLYLRQAGGSKTFLQVENTAANSDTMIKIVANNIGSGSYFLRAQDGSANDVFYVRGDGLVLDQMRNSTTNSADVMLQLYHSSTGTPAANFGLITLWQLDSSTNTQRSAADMRVSWATATDASRKGRVQHVVYDTAAREALRLEASGSAAMIGFYGANAIAKPTVTGSRGGNAALASLLTQLANLGLLTDSSTA